MQDINSNQVLKITSILNTISGGLGVALGIVAIAAGGFALAGGAGADLAATGAMAAGVGGLAVCTSLFDLILGILGIKAANGNGQINAVWMMSLIALALTVISTIASIATGTFGIFSILGLAFVGATYWAANDIKNSQTVTVEA